MNLFGDLNYYRYLCYMKEMKKQLSQALQNLQSHTIGLFQQGSGQPEMVIENDNGLLTTITIGGLGGLQNNHISADKGMYKEFPDGKSLTDMLEDPFALYEFKKQFAG